MTIFTDSISNYFLGDVLYGTHDVANPTISYTKAEKITGNNISTQITSICNSLSINHTISGDWTFPTLGSQNFSFRFPNDTSVNHRFQYFSNSSGFLKRGKNDAGSDVFGDLTTSIGSTLFIPVEESSLLYERQMCGVFSNRSIGLFFIRRRVAAPNTILSLFMYAGEMQDGQISMFTSTYLARSVIFASNNNGAGSTGWHYFVPNLVNKTVLSSGVAFYPINCSDGQTPGTEHTSHFWVRYDDVNLNYPYMGRLPNLLYAQGTYIIGKPVKLSGSVMPDLGHNHWLPVAKWGTYTILMRCYSSLA